MATHNKNNLVALVSLDDLEEAACALYEYAHSVESLFASMAKEGEHSATVHDAMARGKQLEALAHRLAALAGIALDG